VLREYLAACGDAGDGEDAVFADGIERVREHLLSSSDGAAACLICLEDIKPTGEAAPLLLARIAPGIEQRNGEDLQKNATTNLPALNRRANLALLRRLAGARRRLLRRTAPRVHPVLGEAAAGGGAGQGRRGSDARPPRAAAADALGLPQVPPRLSRRRDPLCVPLLLRRDDRPAFRPVECPSFVRRAVRPQERCVRAPMRAALPPRAL